MNNLPNAILLKIATYEPQLMVLTRTLYLQIKPYFKSCPSHVQLRPMPNWNDKKYKCVICGWVRRYPLKEFKALKDDYFNDRKRKRNVAFD